MGILVSMMAAQLGWAGRPVEGVIADTCAMFALDLMADKAIVVMRSTCME